MTITTLLLVCFAFGVMNTAAYRGIDIMFDEIKKRRTNRRMENLQSKVENLHIPE